MTNRELESRMDTLVRSERKITNEILTLIHEAEKRRLYIEEGFSSTHDWLIRKYGYSQSAANRRVQASRLLNSVPEVTAKLMDGKVNLTTLTQVQSTIRREERRSGERISSRTKQELVEKIEGKSADETQRILVEIYPDAQPPKESLRACSADESRLTVVLDAEATEIIIRAKELLSHSHPHATWAEVIKQIGLTFLKARDPLKKKMTRQFAGAAENGISKSALRRRVMERSKQACEFVDKETGRVCGSRHQVQIDHIQPRAMGGSDNIDNLRCLCRKHNILMAERSFGRGFMDQWRKVVD